MTERETEDMRAGRHWLSHLADELGFSTQALLDLLDEAPDASPAALALRLIEEHETAQGKTQGAKFTIRCYPWEKAQILKAAGSGKVEDWIRETLIARALEK